MLILLALISCEKEPLQHDGEEYDGLWIPRLSVQRGNKSVMLNWYEPQFYPMMFLPPNFANPDFADIYISQRQATILKSTQRYVAMLLRLKLAS